MNGVAEQLLINTDELNRDIEEFPQVFPITEDMCITKTGVSRLVMLDRYAFKDIEKKTIKPGDFVVLTVKSDPKFPARGLGNIKEIHWESNEAVVLVQEEYRHVLEEESERETGLIKRSLDVIEKPLEVFYEQIAKNRRYS